MEEQLTYIQYQLWAVIALFVLFVASNLFCYWSRKNENKDNEIPDFGELWDMGEYDKLYKDTKAHLRKYPNHSGALYFRAKVLILRKEYKEAKSLIDTLSRNYPELKTQVAELLDTIDD